MITTKGLTFDAALLLKDSGAVTASGAATVDGDARVLDLGNARVDARTILDVTAIATASNDERYTAQMQFSDSSTFASGVVVGPAFVLGAAEVVGGSADTPVGRYEFSWTNEVQGRLYRYARLYIHTAGTDETITFEAYAM
jgi:hypothetical protein